MKNLAIQLFNGVDEKIIPEKRVYKKQRCRRRRAYFRFNNPEGFFSDNFKEIQAIYLNTKKGE